MARRRLAATAVVLGALAAAAATRPAGAFSPTAAMREAVLAGSPAIVHIFLGVTGSLRDSRDGSVHGPLHGVSSGSGWFIDPDGDIVTAAHVAAPDATEVKQSLVEAYISATGCASPGVDCAAVIQSRLPTVMAATETVDASVAVRVVTQDVAIPPSATADRVAAAGTAATVLASSPQTSLDVAVLRIGSRDDPAILLRPDLPEVGAQTAVVGYPPSAGFARTPTFDYGTVVSVEQGGPGRQFAVTGGVEILRDATILRTDAFAEHGDSGGPTVDDRGRAVGLVSFGATRGPTATFLTSSRDILQVVARARVVPSLGPASRSWRAGLAAYDAGRYAEALADFRSCAAAAVQVGCVQWAGRAETRVGAGTALVPVLAVGAAGVVAAVGALALISRRRRRRPAWLDDARIRR